MASQDDLLAWRDRLIMARASGTRRVRDTDGSEIEYKSDSELARALGFVQGLLIQPPVKAIRFVSTKGLYRWP